MTEPEIWQKVFALAEKGRYGTSPNPRVGAVLVDPQGRVVAEGFHERAGHPHAEAVALAAAGGVARGATCYVNLEPCAHEGRTPPCADALVAAGVARVVCSMTDPDPRTAGEGIARLRAAGVTVEVGQEAGRAARINEPFLVWAREKRPFVHLRWASSLDGKIATRTGASRWISGEASREHSMRLREECDVILVGAGTIVADDPLLTRRLALSTSVLPHRRVVLDGALRVSPEARVFDDGARGEAWLFTARDSRDPALTPFRQKKVHVESLPGAGNEVDLHGLLRVLEAREVRSVLVEGGGETAWSFLSEGLVDRLTVYLSPKLIGGRSAPSPLGGVGVRDPGSAPVLVDVETGRLGDDLMLSGRIGRG
jgi:diaminohydroxyphosphoribosylaminopyrimidine deaminase/5-amino-6-(5-phosphoribosylamino)uracil reductase